MDQNTPDDSTRSEILTLARSHRTLWQTAAGRFVVGAIVIQFVPEDSGFLGQVPYLVSLLFGAFMARLGYTCIRISTAKSHASIAAMFLFLPFTWVLTLLICNGKIQDVLYKHAGSVGFFGVTEKQLEKLTSPDSRSR